MARAPDEVRVLVIKHEVRVARTFSLALEPTDSAGIAVLVPAEVVLDDVRLGEDVRNAGVVFAPCRADKERRATSRPCVQFGERRPVGGKEMRLRLRAENCLTE